MWLTGDQRGHGQGAVVAAAQHHARLLVLQHQRVVGGRQLRRRRRRLQAPLLDVLVEDVWLRGIGLESPVQVALRMDDSDAFMQDDTLFKDTGDGRGSSLGQTKEMCRLSPANVPTPVALETRFSTAASGAALRGLDT